MKHIKKLLSILMVLTLVLSLGATALAATVTLPSEAENHKMVAYQIFTGEQNDAMEAANPSNQLGITGWGADIDSGKLIEALNSTFSAGLSATADAEEVGKYLGNFLNENDQKRVQLANVIAGCIKAGATGKEFTSDSMDLGNGYWVIKDETDPNNLPTGTDGQKETLSTTLLEVVGKNLTLQNKIEKPKFEKLVNDQKADVAGRGERVKFTLTATLPGNYEDFQSYNLKFVDKMTKGLKIDETSFTITYNNETPETIDNSAIDYQEDDSAVGMAFSYNIADLKTTHPGLKNGDKVVLTFYAEVTEDAVIRNENTARIEYSSDPNVAGGGEPVPGPDDKVTVFTFTVNGKKVENDENGDPLPEAGFNLLKKLEGGAAENPGALRVTWETLGDLPKGAVVEYNGVYYVNWSDQQLSKLNSAETAAEFNFEDLGAGEYLLVETKVPEGFNRADDVYFKVERTYDNDGKTITGAVAKNAAGGELGKVEIGQNSNEGEIPETVIDTDGLHLPETGGIGTTIFYVIGAILVAGAVILLVTRKRMSGAQK